MSKGTSGATVNAASAPLTPDQERSLVLYESGVDPAGQHVALTLSLRGELDESRLRQAFEAVSRHHDALRAHVANDAQGPFTMRFAATQGLGAIETQSVTPATLTVALASSVAEPLVLTRACSRVRLLRLSSHEHVLSFVGHRVAFDEASLRVLQRELTAAYARLPDEAVGSALAGWLWARSRDRAGSGWEHEVDRHAQPLRGELSAIELPTDQPRPPAFLGKGASSSRVLSPATVTRLRALAEARGAALPDALITAFFALLQRWARTNDITVGVETSEDGESIGPFTTPQIVRLSVEASTALGSVMQRVADSLRAQRTLPHVDLQELVRTLAVARDRARPPIFQVSVQLDMPFDPLAEVAGLRIERLDSPVLGARTDLCLRLRPDIDGMHIAFDYAGDLFNPSTINRMLDGYLVALDAFDGIAAPIGRLPVMTPAERKRALSAVDRRSSDFANHVHLRFEQHAARAANATAAVFQGHALSYGELNQRANRLAHRLIAGGVKQDTLVGVYCERSFEMLVAVLAVMKAGGAYVPLDPAHPPARTLGILEDAQVSVLLTQEALMQRAPTGPSVAKLQVDDTSLANERSDNPGVLVDPSALVYVIFTSGSTGRPKGVGIEHRALTNFLASMAHTPGFDAGDRVLAVTTLSFDIAGLELYLPLTVGGSIEIADRATCIDSVALAQRLSDPQITVLQATPTTFRGLLRVDWQGKPNLRVLCGGEAFPPDLISALLTRVGEVWNMYGPTETTIWSTARRVTDASSPVSIGGPIDNTSVYVLSPLLEPVPCGAIGEIYIGGDGVARGYYGRPELTAQRFVADPFSNKPGARMYQTGDLGHVLPDGSLTCAGRVDFQVKIRGFRIEIGEIEKALLSCEGVTQTVVTAWEPEPGDKRLVAYVVAREPDAAKLADGLRAALGRELPAYMVPAFFVKLDALPLNPAGKIDRKALPTPAPALRVVEGEEEGRWDDFQDQIHEVFARVLGVTSVNPEDSFFESGGDSILAVKLARELQAALGIDVPLVVVLETPSIRELAVRLKRSPEAAATARVVALRHGTGEHKLFCICGVALYRHLARALPGDLSVFGVYVPAEAQLYDAENLRRGRAALPLVETLAGQYAQVIRREQPSGPYRITGVSFGGVLAYEVARQLAACGEQVVFLGLLDALLPQSSGVNIAMQVLRPLRGLLREPARRTALAKLCTARLLGGATFEWNSRELEELRDALHELVVARYARNMRPYPGKAVVVNALNRTERGGSAAADASAGWRHAVQGGIVRIDVPGDHLGILSPPHVTELATGLSPHLKR